MMAPVRRLIIPIGALLALSACDRSPSGQGAASASAHPSAATSAPAAASASPPASATATSAAAAATGTPSVDPEKLKLEGKAIQGGLVRAKLVGKLKKLTFPGHRVVLSDDG